MVLFCYLIFLDMIFFRIASSVHNEIYYEANSMQQLRDKIRADYPKCKITKNNEVQVYSIVPNTNTEEWWFFGHLYDREAS